MTFEGIVGVHVLGVTLNLNSDSCSKPFTMLGKSKPDIDKLYSVVVTIISEI